ncbi:Aste57867_8528 [Aphanomyces stellatus]|uniref:Aste57867_8528 protein n=1 Tax=Aphanomyces stellatus TaxID=120398 RepID=A0A485KKP9_9STRA|nr:hypothetical protein As57867_008496 [Aphanomyces stellatus]VFT85414.1 Aste57867_8528 [Aphanomyces stellatus]
MLARCRALQRRLPAAVQSSVHQTVACRAPTPFVFKPKYLTLHMSTTAKQASLQNVVANRPIAWWLMGCAAMVGGMVAVGGATRLTRSGLSMVTWKPHGGLPPITAEEWATEFELYKQFPEYQQRQSMTVDDFKQIYFWEYSHRMLGRTVGLAFAGPLAYFAARGRIPKELYGRLGALFGLGALQGGIGWWMVRSGLEDRDLTDRKEVRVSPYRLATHLGMAFTTCGLLTWTALGVLAPPFNEQFKLVQDTITPDGLKKITQVRKWLHRSATVLAVTIMSGAFVAGIDAGMAFNTFPKMDGQWIPDGIFDMEPIQRNFFENTPLVQFDHRVLALTTLAGITGAYALARNPNVWWQLPAASKTALNLNMLAVAGQVGLGITTLLTCVPIPLAIAHQCGALVLMTSTVYSLHTLRFARPLGYKWATTIKEAAKAGTP